MKICKNCGIEYETGNFCKKCGSKLVEKEETLVCYKCGRMLDLDFKYCPECGKKVVIKNDAKITLSEKQKVSQQATSSLSSKQIESKVISIIANACGRRVSEVITDHIITCIGGDVHFICYMLEKEFDITMSNEDREKVYTVGDAVNSVNSHLKMTKSVATTSYSNIIEARVKRIIASVCGRSSEDVLLDQVISCIGGNVHFICGRLKDEFRINISEENEKKIFTVRDAVDVVCSMQTFIF